MYPEGDYYMIYRLLKCHYTNRTLYQAAGSSAKIILEVNTY